MSGDVRSLEEVIAAALTGLEAGPGIANVPVVINAHGVAAHVAAAVREWCLAPQQIAVAVEAIFGCTNFGDFDEVAEAALHAVMGDTP